MSTKTEVRWCAGVSCRCLADWRITDEFGVRYACDGHLAQVLRHGYVSTVESLQVVYL